MRRGRDVLDHAVLQIGLGEMRALDQLLARRDIEERIGLVGHLHAFDAKPLSVKDRVIPSFVGPENGNPGLR